LNVGFTEDWASTTTDFLWPRGDLSVKILRIGNEFPRSGLRVTSTGEPLANLAPERVGDSPTGNVTTMPIG